MNRDEYLARYLGRQQWRVGRKLGRTIYVQTDDKCVSDSDVFIGMMDAPELAHQVVHDHNRQLVR